MLILINLIGEQPIPNLLPILHFKPEKTIVLHTPKTRAVANRLKKIQINIQLVETKPYDYLNNIKKLQSVYNPENKYIFNITGGTKIMSAALFQFAFETESKVIYIDSQNNSNKLIHVIENNKISDKVEPIAEMISIDTYLKVHLNDYYTAEHENPYLLGVKYENEVIKLLKKNGFELIQSVKPKGEGNQLEIDAVIKKAGTNNFAVVEIKSGKENEKLKQGIDQLSTAGSREYLGTYTKRVLITRIKINDSLKKLARKHNIAVIDQISYNRTTGIIPDIRQKLPDKLNEVLS